MSHPVEEESKRPVEPGQRRLLKRLLRWTPRRAVFHRYPVVGRFAPTARKRAYLWSYKPKHVRRGIYLGSVLSLLPIMGVQLPVAFVTSLALRANFMVTGVLQFVTNPLTAAPLYLLTHQVGARVLQARPNAGAAPMQVLADGTIADVVVATGGVIPGIGQALLALIVGGVICGLLLAVVLDVLYLLSLRNGARSG